MAYFNLESEDFNRTRETLRREREQLKVDGYYLTGVITSHWLTRLPGSQLAVLMFVWQRTLFYRKAGELIYSHHFIDGVKTREDGTIICEGTGLKKTALSDNLNELVASDVIHCYRNVKPGTDADLGPRLYQINIAKLLEPVTDGVVLERFSYVSKTGTDKKMGIGSKKPKRTTREIMAERSAFDADSGGFGKAETRPENRTHKNSIYTSAKADTQRLGAADKRWESSSESVEQDEEEPRKPTARMVPPRRAGAATGNAVSAESKQAVGTALQQVAQRTRHAVATRAAAAKNRAPYFLSQRQMQDVFDAAMPLAPAGTPRVLVTGKAYGALKKKLKESSPSDFTQFVRWMLTYWHNLAMQHRKGRDRKIAAGDVPTYEALPASPDFTTIAYRYPYFLKAFASHQAEGTRFEDEAKASDAKDAKIAALTSALTESQRTQRALRNTLTKTKEAVREADTESRRKVPTRTRPTSQRPVSTDSDHLPTWEELHQ